ncbi:LysR family transcriptional regulator [Streptomyces sp. AV19]|uniref:LysR family transcriptional regulator n=1 Tax=Streptomyces sp. AV19 TaxID=2793068 RepID=UPI0018FED822|nr:LysR family transcriptional regulator [Streptomyces sp. AV19]MBH1932967.1 LysR family transcriptional regulator [Streptomyces sp. AV19]MDG4533862.1 LysR family transcriptional regulator [Streptomyces sp. AV19]
MERHEMEAFLTLAEELHFRRTSERLGLAQGRVSQTIRKLERRIGAPLFERTSRKVALTRVGEKLRGDLLPAYQQVQRALADAAAAARGTRDVLRVGYSSPMAAEIVLKAADRFTTRHPDSEVRIQEIQLSDPLGPIRSGQVHLQITELPVDEPDLAVGPVLIAEERRLLVHHEHPFTRSAAVTLEDLAATTLITFAGAVPPYWQEHHCPRRTPSGLPIPHLVAGYWQDALAMVGAGKGVTFASARAEQYYARPDTVWLPFPHLPRFEYVPVWPRTGDTPLVRAFLQTIDEDAPCLPAHSTPR